MKSIACLRLLAVFTLVLAAALPAALAAGETTAAPKYTPQTYVQILQDELARFQTRLDRDKGDPKVKVPLTTAIDDGKKLLAMVLQLIKDKKNLDGPDFHQLSNAYYQAKMAVPINIPDEIAFLQTWIDKTKSDTTQATEVQVYEDVMVLLKRAQAASEKGNNLDMRMTLGQVASREANANAYYTNGQYKGLGPDTARGEYLLLRLERDPDVTIAPAPQIKPDLSNPAIRNAILHH
ncbi:MAG: hypothetical protein ACREJ2_00385 [Planctomycetota bacterium]